MEYAALSKDALISIIYDLEAEISAYRKIGSIDKSAAIAVAFGLTSLQSRIVVALSDGKIKSNDVLIDAIYFRSTFTPESNTISVHISRIKDRLRFYGMDIIRQHGIGVYVDNPEAILAAMRGEDVTRFIKNGVDLDVLKKGSKKDDVILAAIKKLAGDGGRAAFTGREIKSIAGMVGDIAGVLDRLAKKGKIVILHRAGNKWKCRKWRVKVSVANA